MLTLILIKRQQTYRLHCVVLVLRIYRFRPGDSSSTCALRNGISFSSVSIHNMSHPLSPMVTGLMVMPHLIPRYGTKPLPHSRLT